MLAAGDADGNITPILKRGAAPFNLSNVPGGVQDLAWSPDGQSLAAACADGTPGSDLGDLWCTGRAGAADLEALCGAQGAGLVYRVECGR